MAAQKSRVSPSRRGMRRAHDSLAAQAELEAQPEGDFDAFVAAYQASILALAV